MANVIGLIEAMDKSPLSNYQQKVKAHADSGTAPWLGDGMPTTGYQFSAQNSAAADTDMEALSSRLLGKYGAGWFNMARNAGQDTSLMTDEVRGMYEDSLQARAIYEAAKRPAKSTSPTLQGYPQQQQQPQGQQQYPQQQGQQQYPAYTLSNYGQPQQGMPQPFHSQQRPQTAEESYYRATQAGARSRPDAIMSSPTTAPVAATTPYQAPQTVAAANTTGPQGTGFRLPNSNYNSGFAKPQQPTVNNSAYKRSLRYDL